MLQRIYAIFLARNREFLRDRGTLAWNLLLPIVHDGDLAGGATVVLTTHYMDEAQVLCDEIAIMDAGKIIAQGSPDDLLRRQYQGHVIELPMSDITGDLSNIEHRVIDELGIVEIVSNDVSESLSSLSPEVSNLNHIKIRQPNLEDLFLDLTGHSLRA